MMGAILMLLVAPGCSKGPDRIPVYPTEGQVLWEGQPLAGALVVLHPKGSPDGKGVPARAQTDKEGRFRISTYDTADGAPAGEYAVTVQYYPLEQHGESYIAGPNIVPPKYADPKATELAVRVVEGTNTLSPWKLTR
jgi:hypothetical protein